ncbi:MAG: hypothetical protein AAF196_18125 [Planctomycetota bacterium]
MLDPKLEGQLTSLDPRWKIWAGLLLITLGGVLMQALWDSGAFAAAPLVVISLGGASIYVGFDEKKRQDRIDYELGRAKSDWPELRAELVRVHEARAGKGLARFLQDLGYEEFVVRRWIQERFAAELESSANGECGA